MIKIKLLIASFIIVFNLHAQQPQMISDLSTLESHFANINSITEYNGTVYFIAQYKRNDTGISTDLSFDLFMIDENLNYPVLIKNDLLSSVPTTCHIKGLFVFNDNLLFIDYQGRLWKTDGTKEGCQLVSSEYYFINFEHTVIHNNQLFLMGKDMKSVNFYSTNLISTNGKESGTFTVAENLYLYGGFALLNNDIYYCINNSGNYFLYRTDGSLAGVDSICMLQSYVRRLTATNSKLFFSVSYNQLWQSDGTNTGTMLMRNYTKFYPESNFNHIKDESFLVYNNKIILAARRGSSFDGFWSADGISQPVQLTSGTNTQSNYLLKPVVFNNEVYFADNKNVWKTDGLSYGVNIFSISSSASYQNIKSNMAVVGNNLIFAVDSFNNVQLWHYNTSLSAPAKSGNIYQGGYGPLQHLEPNLFSASDKLYVTVQHNTKIFRSFEFSIDTSFDTNYQNSNVAIENMVELNGKLFFNQENVKDIKFANGLVLDSAEIINTRYPYFSINGNPLHLCTLNNKLCFLVEGFHQHPDYYGFPILHSASYMYILDPDHESSCDSFTILKGYSGHHNNKQYFSPLISAGQFIYFTESHPYSSLWGTQRLWQTDGSSANTIVLKDSISIQQLTDVNGQLFFVANDFQSGTEIWNSDGTTSGTQLIKDINPGSQGSSVNSITPFGNICYFLADDGVHGQELWKSDGTAQGTFMVTDLTFGSQSSAIKHLTRVDNNLFFVLKKSSEQELWKTDGTSSGTVLVKIIEAKSLTSFNNELFFAGNDTSNGFELWKSDGTLNGTLMIKDIDNNGSSVPENFIEFNSELYFTANDGISGNEMWKTNGTDSGTTMISDINPGDASSNISKFTIAGNILYFIANDGVHDRELWAWDPLNVSVQTIKNNPSPTGKLYPNPNQGLFNIELYHNDATELRVYNIAGKFIKGLHLNNTNTTINLNELSSGVYFAHLINKKSKQLIKFIIE
jgi:ELWxxDGT repeat protein